MALCKQIWRWKSDFVGSFCNANNAKILTSSHYSVVPLTTRGEMRTTTARSQTPTPRTSATKPRSRLMPLETSATAAPTTTKRSSSTTTKVEQIHPSSTIPTVSTEQPQSNATSRITPATPSTSATASSSAIPSAKLPPEHFPNFLSFKLFTTVRQTDYTLWSMSWQPVGLGLVLPVVLRRACRDMMWRLVEF